MTDIEYINATEASHRYRISDKTMRKWIRQGYLKAEKRAVHGLQQYFIQPSDIEQLIAERELSSQSGLADRLTELEKEIQRLRDRVAALEQSKATVSTEVLPKHADKPVVRARPKRTDKPVGGKQPAKVEMARAYSQVSELPDGSITLAQMATKLGINRTTFLGHVKGKSLEHVAIPKQNRPNECERYFTPEQQQAVKEWYTTPQRRKA